MKLLRNNKGFSLIELLGVLIILGVLFGLVIPRFISFDSNANKLRENYEMTAIERENVHKLYGGEDSLIGEEEKE